MLTKHGAIMAAMVLGSPRAVQVSVYVVRAFVRLREAAALHKELAQRLSSLEEKTEALAVSQMCGCKWCRGSLCRRRRQEAGN